MENGKEIHITINIVAYAYVGEGISGGDRIFVECAKRWAEKGHTVNIFTPEEGFEMCKRYHLHQLENINFVIWSSSPFNRLGLIPLYILRTIKACYFVTRMSHDTEKTIVYSSSDFWPDPIPGFLMSRKIKGSKWIAACYLFAPNPLSNESPYKGKGFLKGLLYYLSQRPTYWVIKRYADMVFVTSEPDRWKFISKRLTPDRVIAIRGGVDTRTPATVAEPEEKKYDAVFIGRFHPQKGVLELVDIWKHVCEMKKDAKLAIIGVGDLEKEVSKKIRRYGLDNNINLLGFQDGIPKFEIFKASRVVLHPAIYDSGGMAACEAMACGLPGVSFDLEALKTYYPKGMLKTPCFDSKAFAGNITELLQNKDLYRKMRQDALDLAAEWEWDKRAEEILDRISGEQGEYRGMLER